MIVVKGEWLCHDGWGWLVFHWGGDEWVSQWYKWSKRDRVIRWCHLVVSVRAQVDERFLLRLMRCRGLDVPAGWCLVLLVIELGRRLLR